MFAALVVASAFLGGVVLYLHNPLGSRFYPPCVFHLFTGFHCPGCGSLRALHQLSQGHLVRALEHNCLLVLVGPILVYYLATQVVLFITGRRLPAFNLPVPGIWALLVVVVVYTVARNVPMYPFTWLAP